MPCGKCILVSVLKFCVSCSQEDKTSSNPDVSWFHQLIWKRFILYILLARSSLLEIIPLFISPPKTLYEVV